MSRKGGILNALEYISQPSKRGEQSLLWNLRATDTSLKEIEKEFLDNSRYTTRRKNGVMIYHEVLSLSCFDLTKAKPEILIDLAQHYLEARATFITQALENNCPIEAVQRSVGHSQIKTTQMYDKRTVKYRESASFAVRY